MKKSLASVEIAAIVNELQFLVGARISKLYHQEKELLLELYLSSQGKELLKIISGQFIFLTKNKKNYALPSNFCFQLRKYLENSVVKAILQKDSERIVLFEIEKKESEQKEQEQKIEELKITGKKIKYNFIIELFSKGNFVLTDENYQIIAVLEKQSWKDREVKVKEKYKFPRSELNWKELTLEKLQTILKKTSKTNLAACLATEIGLGGLYAEEICKYSKIKKETAPQNLGKEKLKDILQAIKKLNASLLETKGYVYMGEKGEREEMTPILLLENSPTKIFESYSEALDTLKLDEKVSPYQQKIKSLEHMIAGQEEAIKKQEDNIILNREKGEKIYEKYADLQKLLEIVKDMKKNKEWKEIELELKKVKKIKQVDLKNKKIKIDL